MGYFERDPLPEEDGYYFGEAFVLSGDRAVSDMAILVRGGVQEAVAFDAVMEAQYMDGARRAGFFLEFIQERAGLDPGDVNVLTSKLS